MRFALLIHETAETYDRLDVAAHAAVVAEFVALLEDDRVVAGERLSPSGTATTLRSVEGQMIRTDGPFADTKEIFGGFYIVDAPDLDAALELAARIPAVRLGGSVEVRPVAER